MATLEVLGYSSELRHKVPWLRSVNIYQFENTLVGRRAEIAPISSPPIIWYIYLVDSSSNVNKLGFWNHQLLSDFFLWSKKTQFNLSDTLALFKYLFSIISIFIWRLTIELKKWLTVNIHFPFPGDFFIQLNILKSFSVWLHTTVILCKAKHSLESLF